jgi:ParB family transcriptional regulator, chromosome partitioning protein
MMAEEGRQRLGLGRGLAALMGENTIAVLAPGESSSGQRKVPIEFVRPNPKNPRRSFDDEQLGDLANSIREKGVIQPILVRNVPKTAGTFEIIAGERRWRAAQLAGVHEVPVIIIDVSDREALEIAIIENVQRTDLNPLDEGRAYEQLASDFGYTQVDLSRHIGKSRSHIANILRLQKLPEYSRNLLSSGQLTAGHARALLSFPDAQTDAMAKRAVDLGLSVRDLERLGKQASEQRLAGKLIAPKPAAKEKDIDTRALERTLTDVLGLVVEIKDRGDKGELVIKYKSLEQLDVLLRLLRS